jgi:hypothetical protein
MFASHAGDAMTHMRIHRTIRLRRRGLVVVLAGGAALVLAACGSGSGSATAPGGGAAEAGGAEAGGGDAPGVAYQSSRFHYRVVAPAAMSEAADGSASARRGVEQLSISVVTGSAAADPQAYAQGDLARTQQASPSLRVTSALGRSTLSGHSVFKVVYSVGGWANPVTGKSEDLVTARYYIPRDASTFAVLAYSTAAAQFDPQGADDVASTFQWQ